MPLSKARDKERRRLERYVQPKYPIGLFYPDGRVRIPEMIVVQPKQCEQVKLCH